MSASDAGAGDDLARRIRSRDANERLPALELASRLGGVPESVRVALVDALKDPIDRSALSDERVLSLQAIYAVADEATAARDAVAMILGSLKRNKSARGKLVQELCTKI